jgi:endo-1,4-beta-xylanase
MKTIRTAGAQLSAAALSLIVLVILPTQLQAQIAAGKSKFLGSTINTNPAPSTFTKYWNQVTPENAGKWGSVEGSAQGVFNWAPLDAIYNFAQQHGDKFKAHNLIWGAQFPSWITSLSQSQQTAAIQTWISTYGSRYPNTWAVDVVNEPIHTPPPFTAALGGSGSTGWDWVIRSFQLARTAFPNAKLLINEYGTENDATTRSKYLQIVALLHSRGLIDGIGVQAHYFNLDSMSASQMTTALNSYATSGLPVYISELDITGGGTDAGQLAKYQALFPVLWTSSEVQGITTWGYIVGQTWHTGTGLVNSNGTERPAMTWLKGFVASH